MHFASRMILQRLLAILFVALPIFSLGLPGCGDDDDGDGPHIMVNTSVILSVVDAQSQPVAGLEVGLANHVSADLPFNPMRGPAGTKAGAMFQLHLPVPARVLMSILDVEGDTVQVLMDEVRQADIVTVIWNGTQGTYPDWEHLPSGHYVAHVTCWEPESGELLFADQRPMAMLVFEPSRYSFGQTDDAGQITIAGRKLFPCFYDLPDQYQYDENGDATGTFNWLEQALIALEDPVSSQIAVYARPIDQGANQITLEWDPTKLAGTTAAAADPAIGTRPGAPSVRVISASRPIAVPQKDEVFSLVGPFPNPFN
jgi:hypothetical protein